MSDDFTEDMDNEASVMNGEKDPGSINPTPSTGGMGGSKLFNTEPSRPIGAIEANEGVSTPVAYMLRGGMKLTGNDGVPAIADLLIGGTMIFLRRRAGGESGEAESGDTTEATETKDMTFTTAS